MIRYRVVHRYVNDDGDRVNQSTDWWDKFYRYCYSQRVNIDGPWIDLLYQFLKECNAAYYFDGDDYVEFESEEDLIMFILRWS